MINHKKNLLVILSIAIIIISIISYFAFGTVVNTGEIATKNISVNNGTIQIAGTTINSSKSFAGYNYMIKNDTLYLKLRYSIVNPIHQSGDFNISFNCNDINIKNMYLQGNRTEDIKLVWTK